jgi:hypothetical protein
MQDPRIHLSESDFMDITGNGAFCNANGDIGQVEFESIMRREMHSYLQVRVGPVISALISTI